MNTTMIAALHHATIDEIKARAISKRAGEDRTCDMCGAAITKGSRYMRARVTIRAYRSKADIGCTGAYVRLCPACLEVP